MPLFGEKLTSMQKLKGLLFQSMIICVLCESTCDQSAVQKILLTCERIAQNKKALWLKFFLVIAHEEVRCCSRLPPGGVVHFKKCLLL